jgi:glutaminyl-peptide cyclotransferase
LRPSHPLLLVQILSVMKTLASLLFCLVILSCNTSVKPDDTEPANSNAPVDIPFQVVKEYPHDTTAFTEGLQYIDGKLYESTGNYGESDIRIVNISTGKPELKKTLEDKYFGEGLTVLNGKAYQLTYQEKTGFVYDAKTLKLEKTFTFNQGEGYGLTNDGKNLILSTGSSNLYFLNPSSLQETSRIGVTDQYGPVPNINELEYIKGYVYANQWLTNNILKIDPASGRVVGKADLTSLRSKIGIPEMNQLTGEGPEWLNGIAYDSASNKIYITGKLWPKLLEVKLDN